MSEIVKQSGAGTARPAPAQMLAIEHASGPVQVLAGPGSGKTYLTIRRIRHLICRHGISPDKILVITFTKAAAIEMKERFYRLTEGAFPGVSFGTFHAIYFQILKRSGYGGNRLRIAAAAEKQNCLKHVLHMHGINDADRELTGTLLKEISRRKNSVLSADDIGTPLKPEPASVNCVETGKLQQLFPVIFKEYCSLMEETGRLDFDDMIFLCDRMLAGRKEILDYWQRAFSHILVDEFQDISPLQYRVLKRLAAPQDNLFVVGDDDQSIYGFRGAGPDIMRQFMQDYPAALQLTLDTNYRSTSYIVQASSLLIAENQNRFAKQIQARNPETGRVVLRAFQEKEEEERHLIHTLKNMSLEELGHTAVICRTNAQLSGLSRPLMREHIPFCCSERMDNIFSHEIAKDFLAYLQYSHDTYGTSDSRGGKREDFLRIMNRPCRYIKRCALDGGDCSEAALLDFYGQNPYMQEYLGHFFADLRKIAGLRPYTAIDYIRKKVGYDVCLCEHRNREEQQKLLETADEIQYSASKYRTLEEWMHYIKIYSERLAEDKLFKKTAEKGVTLLTMHGSKGLEFETVFLPGINAKQIPGRRAHTKEEVEEERRIFYVAMTRAKHCLEISYFREPSPFLAGLAALPCIERVLPFSPARSVH